MGILSGDVKLVASQVMNDVPEGGGAPTATVIQDGASNSIFNDISELDRAGGRVNLRKVFAHIQTANVDGYYGGNVIVADPPDDPRVSVAIFKASNLFDRRDDARDRVEAYLNKGGIWDGYLLENHIAGQRSIQLFQRLTAAIPPIGKTLYLVANEGLATEYSQYVRVVDVAVEERTFTYSNGSQPVDYQANVVIVDLSDALRYDFPGSVPSRFFTQETGRTKTRDTLVADASKYYGAVKTTAPVDIGDVSATVDSIYTQLVPSAQTETPLIDVNAAGNTECVIDASNGTTSITTSMSFAAGVNVYLGNSAVLGSISIAVTGATLVDSGGELLAGTTVIGTVDYARGLITFASSSPTYVGGKTITFKPAAAPIALADSAAIYVSIENRAYNYIQTIIPAPAPKTLVVSFMAQGKWYDLRDNGAGVIKGADPTFGVGTISYTTGTVSITLGALPDVGSEIIYNWGGKVNYLNRAAVAVPAPKVALQLTNTGVTPSSVTITWNDGTARTASDNGSGTISGSASGTIRYQTGIIEMTPTNLPAGGQSYTVNYTYGPPDEVNFAHPIRMPDGKIEVDGGANLIPGTVEVEWNLLVNLVDYISTTPAEMQLVQQVDPIKIIKDNGSGLLKDSAGTTYGTVNYTTGVVSFTPDTSVSVPVARYTVTQIGFAAGTGGTVPVYRNVFSHWEYIVAGASMPIDESGWVKVRSRSTGSATSKQEVFAASGLRLDLTNQYAENIVPGSINFTLGGKTYFDRVGSLYYDINPATGAATQAGSINYQTGDAIITAWNAGQANTITMKSLMTTLDGRPVDEAVFRIPVAPVRPASLQLLATRLTGSTINVTANTNGEISAAGIIGTIDYETGVVRCRFGAWVTAAGNEGEIWYDADAIVGGKIFKPSPVFADTIRYNAVAYSYLPLDADILGLDPVRLPQDGRVPIFRAGDFAVIGDTQTMSPIVATNYQVVNCGRVRLSRVRVIDNDGAIINSGYSADLDAGTVTFTNVSGYAQPVTIEHRVEDMVQVSDVQISGQLAFTRQITHDYPQGATVSAALIAGDLSARVSIIFDQATWNSTWSDAISGSAAAGTYNDVLAPIEVTNIGAQTERWAIQFTSSTAFNVIGEHVGVIATGSTASDIAPINPATNQPYFTLRAVGWGLGWSAGNVLRFNTVGAIFPVWVVRTIQQGPETVPEDSFTLLIRGDVDRP